MWSKIKLYAAFGLGAVIGVMYYLLGMRTRQRDTARTERDGAKRSEQATQAKSGKDSEIVQAGAKARQESTQAARERNDQPKHERRTGRAGSIDRLRGNSGD